MMSGFKEMQVSSVNENRLRMQEYKQLSDTLNEMAKKFEKVVKKYAQKEESNIEIARISLISQKKPDRNDYRGAGDNKSPFGPTAVEDDEEIRYDSEYQQQ